jgi:hypothetical protein
VEEVEAEAIVTVGTTGQEVAVDFEAGHRHRPAMGGMKTRPTIVTTVEEDGVVGVSAVEVILMIGVMTGDQNLGTIQVAIFSELAYAVHCYLIRSIMFCVVKSNQIFTNM